jgi:formylglycine-generating enzyme required for sulfatase activity
MRYFVLIGLFLLAASLKSVKKLKLPKSYKYVPGGPVSLLNDDTAVGGFYMLDHEVTNLEYKEFLYHLKSTGQDSLYQVCYPDTTGWLQTGGFSQPMVTHYYTHPAYQNYPVVNVPAEGMKQFCVWLTSALRVKYGEQVPEARIPSRAEWIHAASGGLKKPQYPWGGPYLQNKEGDYLANFLVVGDHNIQIGKNGPEVVQDSTYQPSMAFLDQAFYTATVNSYTPNGYDLYNMSGNVAEYTNDGMARGGHWRSYGHDIRILSEMLFEKANPYTGFRPIIPF